jgi:hypothetical protein
MLSKVVAVSIVQGVEQVCAGGWEGFAGERAGHILRTKQAVAASISNQRRVCSTTEALFRALCSLVHRLLSVPLFPLVLPRRLVAVAFLDTLILICFFSFWSLLYFPSLSLPLLCP